MQEKKNLYRRREKVIRANARQEGEKHMEEKKKELIKKIDQLKPIDLLIIQNVADVLITRDKIETSKKQLVQQ